MHSEQSRSVGSMISVNSQLKESDGSEQRKMRSSEEKKGKRKESAKLQLVFELLTKLGSLAAPFRASLVHLLHGAPPLPLED